MEEYMKKVKQFIDFEIVTILTILILLSPFYFMLSYFEVDKKIVETETFEFFNYNVQLEFKKGTNEENLNSSNMFEVQVKDFDNNLLYISNSDYELIFLINNEEK